MSPVAVIVVADKLVAVKVAQLKVKSESSDSNPFVP